MKLLDHAIVFAVQAHEGMYRKNGKTPYIMHPMEVAAIVSTLTDDEEIMAAAMMHDIVEDTPVTIDEIRANFGSRVADLVGAETENKRTTASPSETWRLRKEESLEVLRQTKDPGVKMMWLGDKLSNMRSFYRLYLEEGDGLWEHFNMKNVDQQKWYYQTIREYLSELKETPAWKELDTLIRFVFHESEETLS